MIASRRAALGMGLGLAAPGLARAQAWPTRPIRIVVPYAPGGPVDVVVRLVAERAGATLGQPMVIDNRPGGNTAIGAEHVARSAPDGHTVLLATATVTVNTLLEARLGYSVEDFAPVASIVKVPYALAVSARGPIRSLADLAALSRTRPEGLNNGMLGYGGIVHLTAELFRQASGLPMVHVPYRGGGPATTALLGGEIDLYFTGTIGGIPQARAGNLRLLGVTHDSRLPGAPEFPTLAEQGLPTVVSSIWYGLLAPSRTPAPVLDQLAAAIAGAAEEPVFRAQMERDGSVVDVVRREAFGRMMEADLAVWARVIRSMGGQLQR